MQIIQKYNFGHIQINDKSYNTDVIVFQEEVLLNWWRKKAHSLHLDDLNAVITKKPEIIIIGTGFHGLMVVPKELITDLEENGFKVIVKRSSDAVKDYNIFVKNNQNVAVALHLTC